MTEHLCDFEDCKNDTVRFTVHDVMMYRRLYFCSLPHLMKHFIKDSRIQLMFNPSGAKGDNPASALDSGTAMTKRAEDPRLLIIGANLEKSIHD